MLTKLPRTVSAVHGPDAVAFLQNLSTNDLVHSQPLAYTLFLSPNGRYVFDAFVFSMNGSVMLDHPLDVPVHEHLERYSLGFDVSVSASDLDVHFSHDAMPNSYADPRAADLGCRVYRAHAECTLDQSRYLDRIYALAVPEPERDMVRHRSIPTQYGIQDFHSISTTKGCYIGQELIARTLRTETAKMVQITRENAEELKLSTGDEFEMAGATYVFCSAYKSYLRCAPAKVRQAFCLIPVEPEEAFVLRR